MTVRELNRTQLGELKQDYVCKMFAKQDKDPSYGDLVDAAKIPDEIIFEEYDGIEFVEEDFCREEE